MKLASFENDGKRRFGIVQNDGLIDATDRLGPDCPDLIHAISMDRIDQLREIAGAQDADVALDDVVMTLPVPNPEKILCVGVNYLGRNEEQKLDDKAADPSLFFRVPGSMVGHGSPLIKPSVTREFDYEGEIALVISKRCRHVAADEALDVVLGATLCNEGPVHDWLRRAKLNNTQGRNWDKTGGMGPWIVTADDIDLDAPLEITTRVNGEIRQQDSTDRMIYSFRRLIEYVTRFMTLNPGDVLVTGTPVGTGRSYDPPRWLQAGDVVEVSVPEIGTLINRVEDDVVPARGG